MGNIFNKKSKLNIKQRHEKNKKLKTKKSSNNNDSELIDEYEFKFILNDVLLNNSSLALNINNKKLVAESLIEFINSIKNGKIEKAEELNDYYSQLKDLSLNYAPNLNLDKMMLCFVRATCFTREQEVNCAKLYLTLKTSSSVHS